MRNEISLQITVLASNLPRVVAPFESGIIPANGIYFMFENGETVTIGDREIPRIVRIGTHRADGRLAKRIRTHCLGRVRTSVFRRHVAAALFNRGQDANHATTLWPTKSDLTDYIRENVTFACIEVNDHVDRLELEGTLIALHAQAPAGKPSSSWLGYYSTAEEIREFGLWNRQHVHDQLPSDDQCDRLLSIMAPKLAAPGPSCQIVIGPGDISR